MSRWFTFAYTNIARWKERCVVCGQEFSRGELDKYRCCPKCKDIFTKLDAKIEKLGDNE